MNEALMALAGQLFEHDIPEDYGDTPPQGVHLTSKSGLVRFEMRQFNDGQAGEVGLELLALAVMVADLGAHLPVDHGSSLLDGLLDAADRLGTDTGRGGGKGGGTP